MPGGAFISLAVDRKSRIPFFVQIHKQLREAITSGRIGYGTRLPSTRRFAEELGVSRSTVVIAYDHLIADGYAEGRRGSAVYVHRAAMPAKTRPPMAGAPATRREQKANSRPFCPDTAPMDLFPYKAWARAVAQTARQPRGALDACMPLFGDMRLREEVARHLFEWRGIDASPLQIMVTAGPAEALKGILRAVAGKGDTVAMENPGPVALHRYAEALGLTPRWLHLTEDGQIAIESLGDASVVVLNPCNRFPLGGTISSAACAALLRYAEETSGWVVEDDTSIDVQGIGTASPSLFSLSAAERVIYLGSFSRVLSQGLGLGYIVLPPALICDMTRGVTEYDQRASLVPQRPLAELMANGSFDRCLRDMRAILQRRRSNLVERLSVCLADILPPPESGSGTEIVLRLPEGIDDRHLALEANREGLFCRALSYYCSGEAKLPGLVLGSCDPSANDDVDSKLAALRGLIAARLSDRDPRLDLVA